jgi:uncharacterized delta-60 repeat protein
MPIGFGAVGKRAAAVVLLVLLGAAVARANMADGRLDRCFGADGIGLFTPNGVEAHEMEAGDLLALPDGRLLVGGSRNWRRNDSPDPRMRPVLVRFLPNGAPDGTFGNSVSNPGMLELPAVSDTGVQVVEAMRQLADGSVVLAGSTFAFGPRVAFVMKVNADGELVDDFGDRGVVAFPDVELHALDIDSKGRIVAGGERVIDGWTYRGLVVRLTADGTADTTFGAAADGTYEFEPIAAGDNGYLAAVALDAADRVIAAGMYFNASGVAEASIARLDADGAPDASFADNGWRRFRVAGDESMFNGIQRLLQLPDGRWVIAAFREDPASGVGIVLGRLTADGLDDAEFGDAATPGFRIIDVAPEATNRYPSAIARQGDGKLVVSVRYATAFDAPARPEFLAFRTFADGDLDAGFGTDGIFQMALSSSNVFSSASALALQRGKPVLAGATKRDPATRIVDLALVRLENAGAGNQPPAAGAPIADQRHPVGTDVELDVSPNFDDADDAGLEYAATGLPAGLGIERLGGRIVGALEHSGVHTVEVTATDPFGERATQSFTWTVDPDPGNATPVFADGFESADADRGDRRVPRTSGLDGSSS